MAECLFCRIVRKEAPAEIEYEDDEIVVFRDIYPKAPVHLLIVPKRHIESVSTLEEKDASVIARCFFVAKELGERMGIAQKGYRVNCHCGPEGGQVIYHIHFHFLAGKRPS